MNLVPQGPPVKPRLRGVSHEYAFFVSLGCGVALILAASDGRARVAASDLRASPSRRCSARARSITASPGAPSARRWMRRLDHSMIFVLIAGTYTPVALLALKGSLANTILIVVWAGALGGVIFKLVWIDAPKWVFAAVYVALGWVVRAVFGELPAAIGWLGVAGLAARRAAVHGRRGRLRERAAEPLRRRCSATTRSSTRS